MRLHVAECLVGEEFIRTYKNASSILVINLLMVCSFHCNILKSPSYSLHVSDVMESFVRKSQL